MTPEQALVNLQTVNPRAAERITKLTQLEPGWYDDGSIPPTKEAVQAVVELLLAIDRITNSQLKSPFVAPSPDGGLALEWELDSGAELMLSITPTGTDTRYLLDEPTSSGDIDESEGTVGENVTLRELMSRLITEGKNLGFYEGHIPRFCFA